MNLNMLINKIRSYDKTADFELIKKAYETSKRLHAGQKRVSGEDYIVHPLETAYIIAELKLDDMAVCAGLLHDVGKLTIRQELFNNGKYSEEDAKEMVSRLIVEGKDGLSINEVRGN